MALVDDADFDELSKYKWKAHYRGYVYRDDTLRGTGKYRRLYMHRLIMGSPQGMDVDHINGNTLDNRRENLRVCTHAENMRNSKMRSDNTTGFKGVSWDSRWSRWRSAIRVNKKRIYLGYFNSPEDAHAAYCAAALKYHGEFAKTGD